MADDDSAHRGGHDRLDALAELGRKLVGERPRQALGPRRVHQHPRALQVERAAKARGKDEMAFEQRVRGAELGKDLVVGHHVELRH